MELQEACYLMKILSDLSRMRIIKFLLDDEEYCASDILNIVKCNQSTLSYHMEILCVSDLVDKRKEHTKVFYKINKERINELKAFVSTTEFTENY